MKRNKSTVAIASSSDPELGELQADLDSLLSYAQVDAVVRKGLELDESPRALKRIIQPTDWVVIKPNIVTSPSHKCSYWHKGIPHPGQVTDLRVIKSLIGYLIEHCRPQRISIAEGGAEWHKATEPGQEDGWTVTWPDFDGLSFVGIVDEFNAAHPDLVDIVDLNCDDFRFEPVPDPNGSGIGAMQRVDQEMRPPELFGRSAYIPDTGTLREGYHIPVTILDCDKVISVPAMKTHSVGTTLAMKNYIGIHPTHPSGAVRKGNIHKGETQAGFIDLFSYHPADYSLLEGFWSTEGNGPQWGDNIRHNVVVASADPVAADAVGSEMMGFNRLDLDYLYMAAQKGFGTFDPQEIEIVGKPLDQVSRRFKPAAGRKGVAFAARGNRTWRVKRGEEEEEQIFESEERYIDLMRFFGKQEVMSARAAVEVHAKQAQKGWLWAAADGKMTVELNGRIVVEKRSESGHKFAEFKVGIELAEGANHLEVRLERSRKRMGFTALLCDEDGYGLRQIEYRVNA